MKILYVLSFMSRGMAQVWAANKTSVTLANMSMFNTLEGLLRTIEKTFRDPDRERMACTQLQQSSLRGCLCPRTPPIHPFEGLLSDIPPIWHGQLEGSCAQPRPPPKRVCQTETVDPPKPNAIPPD